jgi:urea transport system permease protein
MVIWVALGGRAALAWAAAGAVIVNWAKSTLSENFPSGWLYLEGLLFVAVIAYMPLGVASVVDAVRNRVGARRRGLRRSAVGATPTSTEAV